MHAINKRGQIQLSFGMIFSIFIIIATVIIAGYVIIQFVSNKDNAQCKIYYQKLQDSIDDAWKRDSSGIDVRREPYPSLSENMNSVCFGNISQQVLSSKDASLLEDISLYAKRESNFFFYPSNSCGSGNTAFILKHIKTIGFFCVPVEKGKIGIKLIKGKSDSL